MSFQSNRLQYSKFTPKDFSDYLALVSLSEVMQHITGQALLEEEARIKFNEVLKTNRQDTEKGVYKVIQRGSNAFVGLAKLVANHPDSAEIGYLLLPPFWRQKLGSEIAQAMVEKGKSLNDLKALTAITDPENIGSNKILTNLNFKLTKKGLYKGFPALFYHLSLDNNQK